MRRLFAIIILCAATTNATVWNAADMQQATIQALHDAGGTVDGDTIQCPTGSAYWTGTLTTTKAITIQGAGIGQSIIYDANPGRFGLAQMQTVSGKLYRWSGFEFRPDGTNGGINFNGLLQMTGYSHGCRIDHCQFTLVHGMNIVVIDGTCGVIDHNIFVNGENNHAVRVFHSHFGGAGYSFGDGSWFLPIEMGSTNQWVIETNSGTNSSPGIAITDGFGGARVTFRYNTWTNGYFNTHGTESTGRTRGAVWHEAYRNTIHNAGFNFGNFFRSGSGVICSNILTGFSSVGTMVDYNMHYPFWYDGGWCGTNAWCSNVVTGVSGTHTGSSGAEILTDGSKSWSVNQWVGYTVLNTSQPNFNVSVTGVHPYGMVTANTSTAITFNPAEFTGGNITWTNGNNYVIYKVQQSLDQPGLSTGDLFTGDPPTPKIWPNQVLERFYWWANTLDGSPASVTGSGYGNIREGREFTNAVRTDWIPLVYPHPLVALQDGSGPPPPINVPPVVITGNVKLQGGIKIRISQ